MQNVAKKSHKRAQKKRGMHIAKNDDALQMRTTMVE